MTTHKMHIRSKNLVDMSDKEISEDLAKPDSPNGFLGSPLQTALLSESTRRQIKNLTDVTDKLDRNSEKSSRKLIALTWALLIATFVLVVSAVATIILTFELIHDARIQASIQSNETLSSLFLTSTNTGIINDIENSKPILTENGGKYSDAQLDNYLDIFDTVQTVYDDKILTKQDFCDSFSYFITVTFNNKEVQKYIVQSQKIDAGFFTSIKTLEDAVINSRTLGCN